MDTTERNHRFIGLPVEINLKKYRLLASVLLLLIIVITVDPAIKTVFLYVIFLNAGLGLISAFSSYLIWKKVEGGDPSQVNLADLHLFTTQQFLNTS